jgi:hypothetical protein
VQEKSLSNLIEKCLLTLGMLEHLVELSIFEKALKMKFVGVG